MATARSEIKIVAKYDGKQVDVGLKKLLADMKRIDKDNRAANTGLDGLARRGGMFASVLGRIGPLMGAAFGAASVGAILNTSQEMAKLEEDAARAWLEDRRRLNAEAEKRQAELKNERYAPFDPSKPDLGLGELHREAVARAATEAARARVR